MVAYDAVGEVVVTINAMSGIGQEIRLGNLSLRLCMNARGNCQAGLLCLTHIR